MAPFAAPHCEYLGDRLHLSHGPIDLLIRAWGETRDVARAYDAATGRFATILEELTGELAHLRMPTAGIDALKSPVAKRMHTATRPLSEQFVTPMAAVAGCVADEILVIMRGRANLAKLYVNNGGDIAVWVKEDQSMDVGVVSDLASAYDGSAQREATRVHIEAGTGIGGIATSGWRGRSLSMGIADAVTVLAENAGAADAAATLIANAVDTNSDLIARRPALELDPDSDLGDRPVTTHVGALPQKAKRDAIGRGKALADRYVDAGLIAAAALILGSETAVSGAHQNIALQPYENRHLNSKAEQIGTL